MIGRMVAAALSAVAIAGCSVVGGKAAEEPKYELIEQDGDFEIRAYPALVIVSTSVVAESRSKAVSTGFGRLFDYITGENLGPRDAGQDADGATIDMTAPVLIQPAGSEIAMTAPVLSQPEGSEIDMTAPVIIDGGEAGKAWETIFVLPEEFTLETAPIPASEDVRLGEIPERRVAVVSFSGILGDEKIAANRARLVDWLETRGLAHRDDWQSAGYNPPWTIPALRRNEVIVTLD